MKLQMLAKCKFCDQNADNECELCEASICGDHTKELRDKVHSEIQGGTARTSQRTERGTPFRRRRINAGDPSRANPRRLSATDN